MKNIKKIKSITSIYLEVPIANLPMVEIEPSIFSSKIYNKEGYKISETNYSGGILYKYICNKFNELEEVDIIEGISKTFYYKRRTKICEEKGLTLKEEQGNNKNDNFVYKYECKYDKYGNVIVEDKYLRGYGSERASKFFYDKNGNLEKEYRYEEGKHCCTYRYDLNGQVLKKEDYKYNKHRRLLSSPKYDKVGNLIEENEYNKNGNVIKKCNYNYKYDENGNLIEKYNDELTHIYKYKYSKIADLIQVKEYRNNELYSSIHYQIIKKYSKQGNVIKEYLYNINTEEEKVLWEYEYNKNGTLFKKFKYSDSGKLDLSWEYDKNGNVIVSYDQYRYYKYNKNGVLIEEISCKNKPDEFKYLYNHDENGNLIEKKMYIGNKLRTVEVYNENGNLSEKKRYYDNKLIEVKEYNQEEYIAKKIEFQYDAVGKIIKNRTSVYEYIKNYDSEGNLIEIEYHDHMLVHCKINLITYYNEDETIKENIIDGNLFSLVPYSDYFNNRYVNISYGEIKRSSCREIRITADNLNVIVILKKGGAVVTHAYIHHNTFIDLNIDNGKYELFFYCGLGWNPYKEMEIASCKDIIGGFLFDEMYFKSMPFKIEENQNIEIGFNNQSSENIKIIPSNKEEVFSNSKLYQYLYAIWRIIF